MNAQEREQVRLSILRILSGNPTKYGLPLRYVRQQLVSEGSRCTPAELEAEMQYLEDKELIEECVKVLSPENKAWRINASGRDFLAQVQEE